MELGSLERLRTLVVANNKLSGKSRCASIYKPAVAPRTVGTQTLRASAVDPAATLSSSSTTDDSCGLQNNSLK